MATEGELRVYTLVLPAYPIGRAAAPSSLMDAYELRPRGLKARAEGL